MTNRQGKRAAALSSHTSQPNQPIEPMTRPAPLAYVLAHSVDAMLVIDPTGVIQHASPAAEALFQRPLASLIGNDFGFPIASEDPVDLELLRPDGTIIFVEMRIEPMRWATNQASIVRLHDVTSRKGNEQRLIESQQFLTLTLDALLNQIAILDETGTIVAVNASWRSFGIANGQSDPRFGIGSNYMAICDQAAEHGNIEAACVASGIRSILAGEQPNFSFEYPIDRHWFAVHVTSFRQAGATHVVVAHDDITDRKAAVSSLILFESIFQATSEAILIMDAKNIPNPQIVFANTAFEQISGFSLAELRGTLATRFLASPPDVDLRAWFQQASDEGSSYGATLTLSKAGMHYETEWSLSPVIGADGSIEHFVAIFRDITERRRAEQFDRARSHVLELVAQSCAITIVLHELVTMVDYLEMPTCGAWVTTDSAVITHRRDAVPDAQLRDLSTIWNQAIDRTVPMTLVHPNQASEAGSPIATMRTLDLEHAWIIPILTESMLQATLVVGVPSADPPEESDANRIAQIRQLMQIAIEQSQRIEQLNYQAHYDLLTGLPNRVLFEDRLQHAIRTARRSGEMLAVLFIDLDRFKQINDTLGHSIGDLLLREAASRLLACTRTSDTLARRGGDEFMMVMTNVRDNQAPAMVAQRINDALSAAFVIDGHELFVTASIGISIFPTDGLEMDTLQANADAAMYRVKGLTRNGFQFFSAKISAGAIERLRIENHLRRAIEREELALAYQPIYSNAGQIIATEALLRWHHPELGAISPQAFIPIAEESGLIIPIGAWILQQACQQAKAWQQQGLAPIRVCVNVSAMQFVQPRFVDQVAAALAESDLDGRWLELELTESMLMGDRQEITRQLTELRELHVELAIDDFGTGYSSLGYLQHMPIGTLKIDQSFIQALDTQTPDQSSSVAIVRAIIMLAQTLHMHVTAEGVETIDQLQLLQSLECDCFQGYLLNRPLTPNAFEQLLRQRD